MTNDDVAHATVMVSQLEARARAYWDALASADDATEYQAVMGVVRQAGSLRQSLEQLIVMRATRAPRAAASR
jgi:hypothetical protein